MEGFGNGGSELPAGSSDIVGQLVLDVRNIMTEVMVPKMDSILKLVEGYKSERASMEQEWKLREARIDQLEHQLNRIVETLIATENKRILEDPIPTPEPKNTELRFSNKISQPILTGDEIKAEGNTCIEVSLLDSSTGNIVDVGPVASASVEIVVLGQGSGDWTGEEFNEKIVRLEGKPPLLMGNECTLQGGKGVLKKVKFRHYAAELVKPSEFRLGARIAEKFDGITVKEATTESFVIRSYRNKYSRKNEIPCREDNIWVLKNIQRRGKIDKSLQAKGIDTVEKFLIQLLINPEGLKNIAGLRGTKWKATENHARKCESNRMYCYTNSQETLCVVFDIFGRLQGLHSEGYYTDTNMLSKNKKVDADKLLLSAFEHWENVLPFDDLDSLQQHLAAIKTSFILSNPCVPGQYSGTTTDAGASEMVDESNNINRIPILDTDSLARCDSLGIHDVEFSDDFHFLLGQRSSSDHGLMFTDSGIGRVVCSARIDGTERVSAESEAVLPGSEPPKKWKTLLFCIFLIRKLLNSEANPARKKQKICSRNIGHPISNSNVGAYEMIDGSGNFEFPYPLFDQEILNSDMTALVHYDPLSLHDVGTTFDDFDIGSLVYGARNYGTGSVSAGSEAVVLRSNLQGNGKRCFSAYQDGS
ncbi:uncharacterized protein [Primulina eburnea]|uniref:uncharacterized protein n=1 Tax=Primulina eburnea TaxID=1245227 RepID=UPI003C6CA78C